MNHQQAKPNSLSSSTLTVMVTLTVLFLHIYLLYLLMQMDYQTINNRSSTPFTDFPHSKSIEIEFVTLQQNTLVKPSMFLPPSSERELSKSPTILANKRPNILEPQTLDPKINTELSLPLTLPSSTQQTIQPIPREVTETEVIRNTTRNETTVPVSDIQAETESKEASKEETLFEKEIEEVEDRNNKPRNTEPRNTEPRNTETRNTETRNTETRNTEPRNTEPRNIEILTIETTRTMVEPVIIKETRVITVLGTKTTENPSDKVGETQQPFRNNSVKNEPTNNAIKKSLDDSDAPNNKEEDLFGQYYRANKRSVVRIYNGSNDGMNVSPINDGGVFKHLLEPIALKNQPLHLSKKTIKDLKINTSKLSKKQGALTVYVSFHVDTSGNVMNNPKPFINISSGSEAIDSEALAMVSIAKFTPFIKKGKAVVAVVEMPLTYSLVPPLS